MPGLFTTLSTAANSLDVYQKILETVGNNINNSNTPGYAKLRMYTVPQAFDPAFGLAGGITASELQTSRNEYSEAGVWRNQSAWASADQMSTELSNVEPLFDISGDAGIPGGLNQLFSAISSWSVSPNDSVARGTVIDRADQLAQQFNSMSSGLSNAAQSVDDRLRNAADTINNLTSEIAAINKEMRNDFANQRNPALDTRLHNALENLSEYVEFSVLKQPDGSATVLLGSQTPLVIDDESMPIGVDTSSGSMVLWDSQHRDITDQVTGGRVAGLLEVRNSVLPGYQDRLNTLAVALADSINGVLGAGVDANSLPGAPLFSYNDASDAAFSLQVTDINSSELAAASSTAPGGNSNALDLAALAGSPQMDGLSFTQFYSSLAADVGQALDSVKESSGTRKDLLVQARTMRSELSAVSLDEEAALLLQYQRSYEATARVVSMLNEMTQATIDMMR